MMGGDEGHIWISHDIVSKPEVHPLNDHPELVGDNKRHQFRRYALLNEIMPQSRRWLHRKLPFVKFIDNPLLLGKLFVFFKGKSCRGTQATSALRIPVAQPIFALQKPLLTVLAWDCSLPYQTFDVSFAGTRSRYSLSLRPAHGIAHGRKLCNLKISHLWTVGPDRQTRVATSPTSGKMVGGKQTTPATVLWSQLSLDHSNR
jgi:hypothetical protein